jgi:hypothetical protein
MGGERQQPLRVAEVREKVETSRSGAVSWIEQRSPVFV